MEQDQQFQLSVDAFVRSVSINRGRPVCIFLGAGASIYQECHPLSGAFGNGNRIFLSLITLRCARRLASFRCPEHVSASSVGSINEVNTHPLAIQASIHSMRKNVTRLTRTGGSFSNRKVAKAKPHTGYRLLALLAKAGFVRSVWTPNFDGLVARAAAAANLVCIEIGIDTAHRAERPQSEAELRVVSMHG